MPEPSEDHAHRDFVLVDEVVPPPRIEMARERQLLSRLYIDLIAGINDDYGAEFASHSDSCTLRAIGIYVFYRTTICSPARIGQIGQALGLPKTVVNRRLQDLMRLGYVERVGNAFRVTDKVNLEGLQQRMERRVDLIIEVAAGLSRLRDEQATAQGTPEATALPTPS